MAAGKTAEEYHPERTTQILLSGLLELRSLKMADINNATIIGRLTKDAELAYTPGGMAIATLSIAINRKVKKGENWEDEPNYFEVKIFGKQGEALKQYLTKGKQVGVTGYLKQERWEKNGQKQSKVVINATDIQLIGSKDRAQSQSDNGYGSNSYEYN